MVDDHGLTPAFENHRDALETVDEMEALLDRQCTGSRARPPAADDVIERAF